jgi:hypothetical protein
VRDPHVRLRIREEGSLIGNGPSSTTGPTPNEEGNKMSLLNTPIAVVAGAATA